MNGPTAYLEWDALLYVHDRVELKADTPPQARFRTPRLVLPDDIGPHTGETARQLQRCYPCAVCTLPTSRFDTVLHLPLHWDCVSQLR